MTDQRLAPALIAEALGTFVLVFAGCGAIVVGSLPTTGVAARLRARDHGLHLRLGSTSVARTLQPALTMAFAVGRHFPLARVVPYWGAQGAGPLTAAVALQVSLGNVAGGVTRPAGSEPRLKGAPMSIGGSYPADEPSAVRAFGFASRTADCLGKDGRIGIAWAADAGYQSRKSGRCGMYSHRSWSSIGAEVLGAGSHSAPSARNNSKIGGSSTW